MPNSTEQDLKVCIHLLTRLSQELKLKNQLFLYDSAKLSEDFYCFLLNSVHNLELKNMNRIKANFPAIDLGDHERRLCVQVTSSLTQSKVDETFEKFFKHKLDDSFSDLWLFAIAELQGPSSVSLSKHKGLKARIYTLKDFIKDLSERPPPDVAFVTEFIESELNSRAISSPGLPKYRFKRFLPKELRIGVESDSYLIDDFLRSKPMALALRPKFASLLSQLLMEVTENIFKHSTSDDTLQVQIEIGQQSVTLSHSGPSYNPVRMNAKTTSRQGHGSKTLAMFRRALRTQHGLNYTPNLSNGWHEWKINFGKFLFDVFPFHECTINEAEVCKTDLYEKCETVFVIPDRSMRSTSKLTGFILGAVANLPKNRKAGIALHLRDETVIERLRKEHPNLSIMILETSEIILGSA